MPLGPKVGIFIHTLSPPNPIHTLTHPTPSKLTPQTRNLIPLFTLNTSICPCITLFVPIPTPNPRPSFQRAWHGRCGLRQALIRLGVGLKVVTCKAGLGLRGFRFSALLQCYVEPAIDTLQREVKCIAACEVLQWPDCGRPSNTFTPPRRLGRPSNPNLLLSGFRT